MSTKTTTWRRPPVLIVIVLVILIVPPDSRRRLACHVLVRVDMLPIHVDEDDDMPHPSNQSQMTRSIAMLELGRLCGLEMAPQLEFLELKSMTASKLRNIILIASLLLAANATPQVSAAPLTYKFAGQIADVFQNPNNVIPNLAVGDDFAGYLTFESTGWHHTQGTIFASLNGVDLLFTGSYIYGNVTLGPANRYEISIAGDAGGSTVGSTFNAGNFGPELIDTDGSAGYAVPFPSVFDLSHFETNIFRISGSVIPATQSVSATGRLTQFFAVPEPSGLLVCCGPLVALLARRRRASP